MSKIYTLTAAEISDKVCELALTANMYLPEDVAEALRRARAAERVERARSLYDEIIKNAELAAEKYMPVCQDCGMAVLFIELGQDLHVEGGSLEDAVNEGVRRAYKEGYLRKSVVGDPLADRKNTGDNTPAIIHWKIVPGKAINITITPKGMGSENMSRVYMLKPADGAEGVLRAVVETVREAGSNPCPPIVIGVGIGGNFETAPLAAKEALLVPSGVRNKTEFYAKLEADILREVNRLGIGPSGCGGTVTALDAHIIAKPTHIAGMPVAVNICCHALRHAHGRLEGRG
ncbi:fumarate hydratase [Cloacibacillus sp. An23]|uniref:fumarate hydratase n=1 Tax=Cloacibacillus sp. An23 TaxID=1965591 RepID=UPI000B37BD77|nr:fumarate hydratase [Cloacibacillus sp. An23]OUO93944.1 fumarate hydratase [Cloacibacillus sp. An23]